MSTEGTTDRERANGTEQSNVEPERAVTVESAGQSEQPYVLSAPTQGERAEKGESATYRERAIEVERTEGT